MSYLLCHRRSRPTGRRIAEALGIPSRFNSVSATDTVAVRWGSAMFPEKTSQIQDAAAIARSGNKLVSFQCFKRDGVPCPEFSTSAFPVGGGVVAFGRSTHGMRGSDIVVYMGYPDRSPFLVPTRSHDFFSKYIPSSREYRIHVFKDQILGVMGKYLDFPEQAGEGFIKNHDHGYRFRTPAKQLKADRTDAAIAAVKSLGLDFGAVDILVAEDGTGPYVLEVNTAPALAPLTFNKYIEAFKKELGYAA